MNNVSCLQATFCPPTKEHPMGLLPDTEAIYKTAYGAAYHGDARDLMSLLPDQSIDLVITSPPYALHFKKEYGNVEKGKYVDWFLPFAGEIYRLLKPNGSFVLNIGGSYNKGLPTRSLYHYQLLIALVEQIGFHLAQECFWYNTAKLPSPAEWVNVRRIRIKDSVDYVWWLSPTPWPTANNRNVLVPYSTDMNRLIEKGFRAKQRPSGHNITRKFQKRNAGAIPSNVIARGNNESNSNYLKACEKAGYKPHPARFPSALPEFFIKLLTPENAIVLDPFSGSNTSGGVAESYTRRWLAFDNSEEYLIASALRFGIEVR